MRWVVFEVRWCERKARRFVLGVNWVERGARGLFWESVGLNEECVGLIGECVIQFSNSLKPHPPASSFLLLQPSFYLQSQANATFRV